MFSPVQRKAVFDGLPYVLDEVSLPKIKSGDYTARPTVPSMIVTFPKGGGRARYSGGPLRVIWDDDLKEYREYHGYNMYGNVTVAIVALSAAQVETMGYEFNQLLIKNRLGLWWDRDLIKFVRFQNPGYITSYRSEEQEQLIYSMMIEFIVEYELTWEVAGPVMREFMCTLNAEGSEISITYYAPGAYGMGMRLI